MKWTNSKLIFALYLLASVLTVLPTDSQALALGTPPELLANEADLIVIGQVIESKTVKKPYIYSTLKRDHSSRALTGLELRTSETTLTFYRIKLDKTFKRQLSDPSIEIVSNGGKLENGSGPVPSNFVDLQVGQCIVAFLAYERWNELWKVYGGSLGVFKIDRCVDKEEGSTRPDSPVTRAYDGPSVPNLEVPETYRKTDQGLTLGELLSIIRKEIGL